VTPPAPTIETLVGLALAFLLTSLTALGEGALPLINPSPGLAGNSKRLLLWSGIVFGLWGATWYGILVLLKYGSGLEFSGKPPDDVVLGLAAVVAAQLGRIEVPGVAKITGVDRPASEKDSLYTVGVRLLQSRLYAKMVLHTDLQEQCLVVGLNAAYSLDEIANRYGTWASTRPDQAAELEWVNATRSSTDADADTNKVTIIRRLINLDRQHAISLTIARASAIAYQRAFP